MANEGKWKMTGFGKPDTYVNASGSSSILFDAFMGFTNRKSIHMIEMMLQRLVIYAKALTPVRTGLLKSSIDYFMVPEQLWGAFGSDVPYAKFVEDGTVNMTGAHFLSGALARAKMDDLGG